MSPVVALLLISTYAAANEPTPIRLYSGYVTRVQCEGRLLVSAVGNDTLVRLEALPRELGCGMLLKPLTRTGRTNLVVETTSGPFERLIEIDTAAGSVPHRASLKYLIQGDAR